MQLKKIQYFYVFASAFLFGSGLAVSGMTNPEKILRFLSLGDPLWDPSLLFVLVAAVAVYAVVYRYVLAKGQTVFNTPFSPPAHGPITKRLLLGSIIFGLGWGFTGLCPAPALMRLASLSVESLVFVAAMFAGFRLARE